jgi:hypothetical protein
MRVSSDPLVANQKVCAAGEVTFASAPCGAKRNSRAQCCLAWKAQAAVSGRSNSRVAGIQRLALRVVPTRLAANDMLAIRGTLHLAACGVSNRLLTLLVVFTRTEDAEPEAPCG